MRACEVLGSQARGARALGSPYHRLSAAGWAQPACGLGDAALNQCARCVLITRSDSRQDYCLSMVSLWIMMAAAGTLLLVLQVKTSNLSCGFWGGNKTMRRAAECSMAPMGQGQELASERTFLLGVRMLQIIANRAKRLADNYPNWQPTVTHCSTRLHAAAKMPSQSALKTLKGARSMNLHIQSHSVSTQSK